MPLGVKQKFDNLWTSIYHIKTTAALSVHGGLTPGLPADTKVHP